MVTIGNADQVMALVRSQLERMARAKRGGSAKKAGKSGAADKASGETRLKALSALAGLPDEEFERMLVGALLTQEFGEEAARDARFQEVVDRTVKTLRGDPDLARLIAETGATLRGG